MAVVVVSVVVSVVAVVGSSVVVVGSGVVVTVVVSVVASVVVAVVVGSAVVVAVVVVSVVAVVGVVVGSTVVVTVLVSVVVVVGTAVVVVAVVVVGVVVVAIVVVVVVVVGVVVVSVVVVGVVTVVVVGVVGVVGLVGQRTEEEAMGPEKAAASGRSYSTPSYVFAHTETVPPLDSAAPAAISSPRIPSSTLLLIKYAAALISRAVVIESTGRVSEGSAVAPLPLMETVLAAAALFRPLMSQMRAPITRTVFSFTASFPLLPLREIWGGADALPPRRNAAAGRRVPPLASYVGRGLTPPVAGSPKSTAMSVLRMSEYVTLKEDTVAGRRIAAAPSVSPFAAESV